MKRLSVLIVINNEEKQIEECLKSVKFANEIVVILDKCTDNSEKIVKKYTRKFFCGKWNIEGKRRNFGISKCSEDWILEIDADERVSKKLSKEILETINSSDSDWHTIPVKNFLGKKEIIYGWGAYFGKSAYSGLFKRNKKVWGNQRVHPKIKLVGKEGKKLKNKLHHFYCKSVFDLFVKLDSYSTAKALDLVNYKKSESLNRNVRRIFSRFWKCFFLRKGYKEKHIGFLIALVASLYPISSYLKYKEKND